MIFIDQYRFPVVSGGTLVTITYGTVSGTFVESPAGKWGAGPGYGLSALSLPASTDGYYQVDYTGFQQQDSPIGFDAVNTNTDYTTYDFALYVDSGTGRYATLENLTQVITAVSAVAADKFRIRRSGSALFAEKTSDGTNWTALRTFTGTSTARLYIKAGCAGSGTYILNPKGTNIT